MGFPIVACKTRRSNVRIIIMQTDPENGDTFGEGHLRGVLEEAGLPIDDDTHLKVDVYPLPRFRLGGDRIGRLANCFSLWRRINPKEGDVILASIADVGGSALSAIRWMRESGPIALSAPPIFGELECSLVGHSHVAKDVYWFPNLAPSTVDDKESPHLPELMNLFGRHMLKAGCGIMSVLRGLENCEVDENNCRLIFTLPFAAEECDVAVEALEGYKAHELSEANVAEIKGEMVKTLQPEVVEEALKALDDQLSMSFEIISVEEGDDEVMVRLSPASPQLQLAGRMASIELKNERGES